MKSVIAIKPYRIDIHHHIVPSEYLTALANIGIKTAVGEPFPCWTPEKSIELMDRQGIRIAITSISAPGIYFGDADFTRALARECNEFSARLLKKYPQRFGAFAVLPVPDIKASLVELKYALDVLMLDGVVMLTNIDGVYIGDLKFNEILSELNQRKAVVFVHPNSPPADKLPMTSFRPAILEFVFDTTRAVANLVHGGAVKRYPDIRFIFSHAGGTVPYLTWRISFGNKKIINLLKRFYYDIALSATPYSLNSLLELVKSTQILFGTDYPFAPEPVTIKMIKELEDYNGLTTQDRTTIEQDNAFALFPRFNKNQ